MILTATLRRRLLIESRRDLRLNTDAAADHADLLIALEQVGDDIELNSTEDAWAASYLASAEDFHRIALTQPTMTITLALMYFELWLDDAPVQPMD